MTRTTTRSDTVAEVAYPPTVLMIMIGDPESGFDEEQRSAAVTTLLYHFQNDPSAIEAFEVQRHASGTDDEATVHDLTEGWVRERCDELFQAVLAGRVPDPRILFMGRLPEISLTEDEQALFNLLAAEMPKRLVADHFLHREPDGTQKAEADFYVLLVGLLTNIAAGLKSGGRVIDASLAEQTAVIAMKLFALHVREARKVPNGAA
jgi:hypothetical protein